MFDNNKDNSDANSSSYVDGPKQRGSRALSLQIIMDLTNNLSKDQSKLANNGEDSIVVSQRFPANLADYSSAHMKVKNSETSVLIQLQNDDTLGFKPPDNIRSNSPATRQNIYEDSIRQPVYVPSQRNIGRNYSKKVPAQQQSSNSLTSMDLKLITMMRRQVNQFFCLFTYLGRNRFFSNENVRKFFNDKSDFNKFLTSQQKCFQVVSYCVSRMDCLLKRVPLLDPDSSLYFLLQFLFCTYHTMFFLLFTLVNIFDAPAEYNQILSWVTVAIWLIEVLLRVNTKLQITSNNIIRPAKRNEIVNHYISNQSVYDMIPILLLIVSPMQEFALRSILQIIVGLKTRNAWLLIEEFQRFLCMTFKDYYLIQLTNLIIKLFIIGHIIACMWYLVGYLELYYLGEATTWYDEGLADYTWWKLYLQSMYWSLTLMTTGSNTATTVSQLVFTVFIMLFTTIIFGYMLNVIGFILEEMDKKDENKRRDLNLINEYMRSKNISKQLQKKINVDLEYFYEKNFKKIEEDNQEILEKISNELNEQLKQEYNREIMQCIPIIKNNFSQQAIEELANVIEEVSYFPNQIIYQEDDNKDLSLMYIVLGSVEFQQGHQQQSQKQLRNLSKGSTFGELSFFNGFGRESTARASDFTKIIKINREKFIEAIQSLEKDFEIFHAIKDKINLYSNFVDVMRQCEVCGYKQHLEHGCPFVHQSKSPWIVKSLFERTLDAVRIKSVRPRMRQRLALDEIQLAWEAFQNDHFDGDFQFEDDKEGSGAQNSESSQDEDEDEIIDGYQGYSDVNNKLLHDIHTRVRTSGLNVQLSQSSEMKMLDQLVKYDVHNKDSFSRNERTADGTLNYQTEIPNSTISDQPNVLTYNTRIGYFSENTQQRLSKHSDYVEEIEKVEVVKMLQSHSRDMAGDSSSNEILGPTKKPKKTVLVTSPNMGESIRYLNTMKKQIDKMATSVREPLIPTDEVIQAECPGSVVIWELDRMFEYRHYFTSGNVRAVMARYVRLHRKKFKSSKKSRKKI